MRNALALRKTKMIASLFEYGAVAAQTSMLAVGAIVLSPLELTAGVSTAIGAGIATALTGEGLMAAGMYLDK